LLCIAVYCVMSRVYGTPFSDKIFLENFLENFLEKMIFGKVCFYYEEKRRQQEKFYSDLFIFDNISGGVVCIWENRDSGSRLYVCMYGMSFRRGCSDTGVSDRVFWILSTTVVF